MHALVEERLAPGGVCLMTQQRSGGHWQSLDGGRGDGGSVIPRQAPRHGASEPSHEDTLVKMLYEEHAGPQEPEDRTEPPLSEKRNHHAGRGEEQNDILVRAGLDVAFHQLSDCSRPRDYGPGHALCGMPERVYVPIQWTCRQTMR